MTTMTPEDAIKAASSVARDVADGRLTPADLEAQLDIELRELVGVVVGEGDPLYALQCEIARGVLAVGGVPADELAEWLAVARHQAGEPVSETDPDETPPQPISLPTVALSPESVDAEPITEPPADTVVVVEPVPVPVIRPPVPATEYDALRGWDPGGTRRL